MHGGERLVEVGPKRLRGTVDDRAPRCLVHEGRFDARERMGLLAEQGVNVLCQSPTEYRMIAARPGLVATEFPELRRLVSAGEPLNPEVIEAFETAVGLSIYDGYGQTETGQLTGMPAGEDVRPGSMGKPLPGFRLEILDDEGRPAEEGELSLDPATVPTFFRGYLGQKPFRDARWMTGDRVRRDEDGYLWFEGRLDDVILSGGYRIGPFEVESALVEHPAVAEAAAVSAPRLPRADRSCARSSCCASSSSPRPSSPGAAGAREDGDRALQVPAHRRVPRRAAEDLERQDQAGGATRCLELSLQLSLELIGRRPSRSRGCRPRTRASGP